ncbi:MAG: glycosyltransferase [Chloroflexi bacterium]|nr:glycosyltransferase [Chloroflexota bacterium]
MNLQPTERVRLVFLFSDTGGGHRSAAEAIIEAIEKEYPNQVSTAMVDFFREYAPRPLDMAPEIYPPLTRLPDVWQFGYRVSDGRRRARLMNEMFWPYIRRSVQRLLREHPCDLLVSVHPLINNPVLHAMTGQHYVPYATVVTDLVSTHAAWFDARADLVVVPTGAARQRGLQMGLRPEQLHVIGLPVADRFTQPAKDVAELRRRLDWPLDRPVLLLVGGGEGMGPLEQVAQAIHRARLDAALVIIAGRNQALKARLEAHPWQMPVKVYGFVREMPDFMRAADVLITKAGPGTICEAFIAGLPLILYSRLPGQEEGNVRYVVEQGAGVWAPESEQVVATLQRWLRNPEQRQAAAEASHSLARPQAARQIARLLVERAGVHHRAMNPDLDGLHR